MEKRVIKKIAVLGSGVMGSRIACHFAGIGVQVLLLDIVPEEARDSTNPAQRNKIVNDSLQAADFIVESSVAEATLVSFDSSELQANKPAMAKRRKYFFMSVLIW